MCQTDKGSEFSISYCWTHSLGLVLRAVSFVERYLVTRVVRLGEVVGSLRML